MTDKRIILREASEAFFMAMMAGYAGDGTGSIKTASPDGCEKTIEFTTGDFKVIDRYCVTPHSTYSAGTTTIFFKNIPVWWMAYGGFYSEQVIPFLKEALGQTYKAGLFSGGRGPKFHRSEKLIYQNFEVGGFERFKGREEIRKRMTSQLLGYHEYFGMAL